VTVPADPQVMAFPPFSPQAWLRQRIGTALARLQSGQLDGPLVALIAFAVYDATLTPSLSYVSPDGNELATVAATLGLAHPTGYPLYTWLGKAFTLLPAGDIAHRVNLLSAVGAAGAAGFTVLILRELKVPRPVAAFAGLVLAFSPTLWSQATISEVYAPNLLFVALEIYLLLLWGREQRDARVARDGSLRATLLFAGWASVYSLSFGLHLSGLGFAPAFAIYILIINRQVLTQPLVLVPAVTLFLAGLMQFLWIPVRFASGSPAPDPLNPLTVDGFLAYTVDAFPQFKWAFPLELLPDRFMVYGTFVLTNFGWPGALLAVAGSGALAIARPRTFLMLSLMWGVHVIFFMEYRAQDLEVFFLPAHLILVLAAGFGLGAIWRVIGGAVKSISTHRLRAGASALACLLLAAGALFQVARNYSANDRSEHTEINDFYTNVFELLPADATLAGAGGVFGYDMFYYPLVYDVRPDVSIPAAGRGAIKTAPSSSSGTVFSISSADAGGRNLTLGAPGELWSIPVLVAPAHDDQGAFIRRRLVLYEQSSEPPPLTADNGPQVSRVVLGAQADLLGLDLDDRRVERGETVTVRLYWAVTGDGQSDFSLQLGSTDEPAFEAEAGFGLWDRYSREVEPLLGRTVVDTFELVVLSSAPTGTQPLLLTLDGTTVQIAELEVF